jgi:predicted NBD/HSP70 family sugar kinase
MAAVGIGISNLVHVLAPDVVVVGGGVGRNGDIVLTPVRDAITRYGFYVLPGRVVMAGCYIEASLYPIYTTLFETTVSSVRPW